MRHLLSGLSGMQQLHHCEHFFSWDAEKVLCDHLHSAWCVAGCTLSTVTVMTAARSSLTLHSYFDGRLCLIRAPRDAATSVNSGYFIVIRCSIQTSGFYGLFHPVASLSPNETQAKRQIGLG